MRVEDYVFDLLTPDGLVVSRLEGIEPGGHLTGNSASQIRWSGTLTYHGDITPTQWYKYRIRPALQLDGKTQPLGVYVVRPSTQTITTGGGALSLDLYDRTFIPANDALERTYCADAGVKLTSIVKELLESTGEENINLQENPAVTKTPMVWEAGTAKLRLINDLLQALGFFSLHCDFNGTYRIEPYTPPVSRPILKVFTPGQNATHLIDTTVNLDAKVPNKIICLSQETATQPAMRAVALNENPASPYSFQNQGVWVARTITGIEAASQAVLDQTATRMLSQAGAATTIKRALATTPIPLGSVVTGEQGTREVVENVDITLTPATLMSITSRQTHHQT